MMHDEQETHIEFLNLETAISIIEKHAFVNSYILDYFVDNVINEIPESWMSYLLACSYDQLAAFLTIDLDFIDSKMPKTLQEVREQIRHNSLPRNMQTSISSKLLDSSALGSSPSKSKNAMLNLLQDEQSTFAINFFRKVKKKKQYEICILGNAVYKTALQESVDVVVDIGSGKGHLSRYLALICDLNVISIEAEESLVTSASNMDSNLCDLIVQNGLQKAEDLKLPKHITKRIENNLSCDEFIQEVSKVMKFRSEHFSFGIVGLHPCGNLAPTLLKLFLDIPQCKFIKIASCCYMKLNSSGFPLCNYMLSVNQGLSYNARELACHSIEQYIDKLTHSSNFEFKVHVYRAVLEVIIRKKYPDKIHVQTRNVKVRQGMNFEDYVKLSLAGTDVELKHCDIINNETDSLLTKWREVIVFYSLRTLFAPLIETVVLLDRMSYVKERGSTCEIKIMFQPVISPRVHVLCASKQNEGLMKR